MTSCDKMMTSRGVVMTSRGVISKLEFEADIKGYYSLNSLAMLTAMSLKANELPDIRLKRTPFRDRRGSLQTSISH